MKLTQKAKNVKERLRYAMKKAQQGMGLQSSTWGIESFDSTDSGDATWKCKGPVCALGAFLIGKSVTTGDKVSEAARLLGIKYDQADSIIDGFDYGQQTYAESKSVYRKIGVDLRKAFIENSNS